MSFCARLAPLLLLLAACKADQPPDTDLCSDGTEPSTWFVDADGDGYGDASADGTTSCTPVRGAVTNARDCDDADPTMSPDAPELCNGLDDNCTPDDDLVDGGLALDGRTVDDLADAVDGLQGEVVLDLCGGTHDVDGVVVPDGVTTLTIQGVHPSEPSSILTGEDGLDVGLDTRLVLRDLSLDGPLPATRPGAVRRADLDAEHLTLTRTATLGWATLGTARVVDVQGGGVIVTAADLDVVDIDADFVGLAGTGAARDLHASELFLAGAVTVRGVIVRPAGRLTVEGGVSLRQALVDQPREVNLRPQGASLLLEDSFIQPGPGTSLRIEGEGRLRGLWVEGGTTEIDLGDADTTLVLDRPYLALGQGMTIAGEGALFFEGGTVLGQSGASAGAIYSRPDGGHALTLRGTALLRNGALSDGAAVLVTQSDDTLVLDGVVAGSGSQPNRGPLVRHGEVVWDGTGVVSLTCQDGACAP